MCVYCGAQPETRDHVPSKVLLDEPYPPQLPVVGACERCNASFALDEQYLACFIECVICGTVEPSGLQRTKIKRILNEKPALQRMIKESRRKDEAGNLTWKPEIDRVRNVVSKLAQGHTAYELYPIFEAPLEIIFTPLPILSKEEQAKFENMTSGKLDLLPEIGSRAFHRVWQKKPVQLNHSVGWVVVQPERYRYSVSETSGVLVQLVLSEYLGCIVSWE